MKGIIILNEIPENCSECWFSNHCGECLVDGGRCDYKSKIRPNSCPIEKLTDIKEYDEVREERNRLKEENKRRSII